MLLQSLKSSLMIAHDDGYLTYLHCSLKNYTLLFILLFQIAGYQLFWYASILKGKLPYIFNIDEEHLWPVVWPQGNFTVHPSFGLWSDGWKLPLFYLFAILLSSLGANYRRLRFCIFLLKCVKDCRCTLYSGVLLKWEFFIKMRAAYFAPSFLKKEEYWSEDGCK